MQLSVLARHGCVMSLENQYQQTLKTKQCPTCGVFVDPSLTVCPHDGTSLVERFDKDPAFVNYEFLGTIGSGGMGVIYKARQVILNKFVAIKTLHPHLSSPSAFRRFQIEGQATSLLKHPFIVSVHDFGMTKSGQTFMIMDFIDGETLDALLRRIGQLDEAHFLNIFIDVCDALAHAHARSVIHRDIKSSNIMIVRGDTGKEEIRIMDFGIAKLVSDSENSASQVTKTGEVIGTATCMSPEQARGGKVDHRSDLYALGCVMYECFASAPPFVGHNALETMLMHLEKKPLSIKEASMGHVVDPRIEKIIFCLLEKDPDHRYQSMLDLKHDLENLRNTRLYGEWIGATITPSKQVQSSVKTWQVATIIGALIVTCVAFTGPLLSQLKIQHKAADNQVSSEAAPAVSPVVSQPLDRNQSSNQMTRRADSYILPFMKMPAPEIMIKPGLQSQLDNHDNTVKANGYLEDILDSDLVVFKGDHPDTQVVDLNGARKVTDEGLKNLRDLRLTELNIRETAARDFDWISNQLELKRLSISVSKVSPRGFKNIGKLRDLRRLEIDKTEFSDSDVDSLIDLANLEVLNIARTKVSVFGYDRLLNAFHKLNNLIYFPLNMDGQDYLSGSLAKIDHRPAPVIFKDAQQAMLKSNWRDADVALERIIIRMTLKEIGKVAALEDRQMLVQCEAMRGDCLKAMKLPYAAIYMYNTAANHIHTSSIGDVFVGDMQQRAAGVWETLPSDPIALNNAIVDRSLAEDKLRLVIADPHWAAIRAANLESLKRDEAKARH
jgi:serine/threonine protein kinase